jgi:hypothetical protein
MIDPSELDIDGVIRAVVGVVATVVLAGVLVGVVVNRFGGRRLPAALFFGVVAAVALAVDVVVVARALSGDATGWDILWAVGLTLTTGVIWRYSAARPPTTT